MAKKSDKGKLAVLAGADKVLEKPRQIKLFNKMPKRNTFLPNAYRDERDAIVLNAEIGKRQHKGKIKTITTIKHMDIDKQGFWVTEFIIDLKE